MSQNAVATPHHLSADAARHTLTGGGNAIDAAIAAVAAQGVVAPETCGVGGDLFAVVHRPGWDRPLALNASGRSGSNASAATLRAEGHTDIPSGHPLAVTIPGCIDGLQTLSARLGRVPLGETLTPAIDLARGGSEVSTEQAAAFTRNADIYRDNPAVDGFYPNREPIGKGATVTRRDLATTLEAVAKGGRDAFYGGQPGRDIVEAVDGLITMADMEAVQAEWVEPIGMDAAGLTSWTVPPNSQGYLGPGTLALFEMLDPPDDPEDPLWWHLLIEAYRSLAWERDDLVADPDTLALPADLLLDRGRVQRAAASVSREKTGVWPQAMGHSSGTAYLCVVDAEGMAVSIIQSNYRGTGSPFGAARSGFLLQDRGAGFGLTPGHPNELGPGKRPLHTLSPTLWADDSGPRWLLGTRGGSVQPQLVAQVAARSILGDQDLADSQRAPRWAVPEFGPGSGSVLSVEPGVSESVLVGLRSKGHIINELTASRAGWGPVSIIGLDDDSRRTAADPRVDTTSAIVF